MCVTPSRLQVVSVRVPSGPHRNSIMGIRRLLRNQTFYKCKRNWETAGTKRGIKRWEKEPLTSPSEAQVQVDRLAGAGNCKKPSTSNLCSGQQRESFFYRKSIPLCFWASEHSAESWSAGQQSKVGAGCGAEKGEDKLSPTKAACISQHRVWGRAVLLLGVMATDWLTPSKYWTSSSSGHL